MLQKPNKQQKMKQTSHQCSKMFNEKDLSGLLILIGFETFN